MHEDGEIILIILHLFYVLSPELCQPHSINIFHLPLLFLIRLYRKAEIDQFFAFSCNCYAQSVRSCDANLIIRLTHDTSPGPRAQHRSRHTINRYQVIIYSSFAAPPAAKLIDSNHEAGFLNTEMEAHHHRTGDQRNYLKINCPSRRLPSQSHGHKYNQWTRH